MAADTYMAQPLPRSAWGLWEQLLDRCPQSNPFVRTGWLEPLARALGAEIEISICYRGEEPVGGFAAFVTRGPLGRMARLPPLTPYNTVAILPRVSREIHRSERHELQVLRAIRRQASDSYDYVRFVHHPALRDVRAFEWDGWRAAVFYTHQLWFHAGSDPLAQVASDLRRRAAQAERSGVRLETGGCCGDFYPLLLKTYERQHLALELPRAAFLEFTEYLRKRGLLEVRLARSASGEALAGELVVLGDRAAYLWMAAADPSAYDSGANQLLLIETIRDLSTRVEVFDLCGAFCPPVAHYKSAAGGELTPYYTVWTARGRRARWAVAGKELLLGLGLRRGGGYW
jgi:hypothetical protein